MTRTISLAHLTVLELAPPAMIRLAAATGYDAVGLRLRAVTDTTPGYPLMTDRPLMRETRAALVDTGIAVNGIEFVKITPELSPASLVPLLDAGAEVGARHLIVAPYDPDLGRLSDRLAAIAVLAAPFGIRPVLEFFPWTVVPDLATCRRVVEAAGRQDLGILVDTLHFDRSGSRLQDLAALPAARLPFLHLCDAPVAPPYSTEDLLHAGRAERLPPGEGGIDLAAILAQLPADLSVELEVPMTALAAAEGPEAVARRALAGARRVLGAR